MSAILNLNFVFPDLETAYPAPQRQAAARKPIALTGWLKESSRRIKWRKYSVMCPHLMEQAEMLSTTPDKRNDENSTITSI